MKSLPSATLTFIFFLISFNAEQSFAQTITSEPKIIGHRGLIHEAPENTLAAFSTCINLHLGIELDIRRTKDGALVILHDEDLNRTTNSKGKVFDINLLGVKNLDAGSWFHPKFKDEKIPTLEEFFTLLRNANHKDVLVAIDIKITDNTLEKEIIALANKYGVLNQLVFIGLTINDAQVRYKLKFADALASVAVLANKRENLADALSSKYGDWIYVRFIPNAEEVKKIHGLGKKVFIAGIQVAGNEPKNWHLCNEAGLDAILTDYPFESARLFRSKKPN